MLVFAVQYRTALEAITGDRNLTLRSYELNDEEWHLVEHLYKVLEACNSRYCPSIRYQCSSLLDLQTCYRLFLSW